METVAGLFNDFASADRAVSTLHDSGFEKDAINLLAQNAIIEENVGRDRTAQEVFGSAGAGMLGGGLAGGLLGLLAGVGAIAIPGLGPAVAAGSLAAALGTMAGGAGVGAGVGGIIGGILGLSIPEEDANVYAEGVMRGGILVAVQAEGAQVDLGRNLLREAGAQEPRALREEWQKSGWQNFDENKQ